MPDGDSPWPSAGLAVHRISTWPSAVNTAIGVDLATMYETVKATGLHIGAWEYYLTQEYEDLELLQFTKYGFPQGYMGPPSNTKNT